MLTVGVFGKSRKKEEKRVPIHPLQFDWISDDIKKHLYFEKGYGLIFGMEDDELKLHCKDVLDRDELMRTCEVALLAKPTIEDFRDMRNGTIHWGWPHCVQQKEITQLAIDKELTLIAWEAMHRWSEHGDWLMHIFHKNNEIAGYAGVQHAMNLVGIDGNYGRDKKAVVLSFGSVSRGAIHALKARGVQDITVFTQRHFILVADQMSGITYYKFGEDESGQLKSIRPDHEDLPFMEELKDADIIVNGILQDTDEPIMFVPEGHAGMLKLGCLIVDVSCDEGMGFYFAKPTTFDNPILKVGNVYYYAVDHTPSYLWNAASWEISNSVIPYLPKIMEGPDEWLKSETIRRAIEIQNGRICNPKILSFQNRSADYPHQIKG